MSSHRISLLSGGFFDFVDMDQSVYTREDIAHNLSRLCRFTGATLKHYSIAQHAVIVSYAVPEKFALGGLCHDDSEAVCNDLNTPLKSLVPQYKKIEKAVEKEMFARMNLPFPMHPAIKVADTAVFLAENRDLRNIISYAGDIEAWPKKIVPWTAEKAKREYLKRFEELTK